MTTSRVLCAAATAAIFGFGSAAGAVAEAEPEASELLAESAETAAPTPEPTGEGMGEGSVARSAFTTAIAEREPTDTVKELSNQMDRVLFFTELHGLVKLGTPVLVLP